MHTERSNEQAHDLYPLQLDHLNVKFSSESWGIPHRQKLLPSVRHKAEPFELCNDCTEQLHPVQSATVTYQIYQPGMGQFAPFYQAVISHRMARRQQLQHSFTPLSKHNKYITQALGLWKIPNDKSFARPRRFQQIISFMRSQTQGATSSIQGWPQQCDV